MEEGGRLEDNSVVFNLVDRILRKQGNLKTILDWHKGLEREQGARQGYICRDTGGTHQDN